MATLTLIGMTIIEPNIWDGFTLPENLDTDTAKAVILNHCGNNEIRYPDAQYMKFYISVWCKMKTQQIQKMYNTTILDYNPIHNYNMKDTINTKYEGTDTKTNTKTGSDTEKETGTDTTTRNGEKTLNHGHIVSTDKGISTTIEKSGSVSETEKINQGTKNTKTNSYVNGKQTSTTLHEEPAYNGTTLATMWKETQEVTSLPTTQEITTNEPTGTSGNTKTTAYNGYKETTTPSSGTDKETHSGSDVERYNNYEDTRIPNLEHKITYDTSDKDVTDYGRKINTEEEKSGNIGVTTTQKMIQEEREITAFNVYEWIADIFENDFTLGVYNV